MIALSYIDRSMLCFQSFNRSPSIIHHFVSRYTRQREAKRNRAAVKLAASIISQAEEIYSPEADNHTSLSDLMIDQTNAIGILGGKSSLHFARKLIDQEIELPLILYTDPALSNELLLLDRSSFSFLSAKPEQVNIDHGSIVKNLRRKRVLLEKSGVGSIVMPCHISHYWYDEIKEGCSVPFLHMGESVAKELKEAKLKPIVAGSSICIGVLATNTTLVARMYQEKLEKQGFKVVMPDKNTMKHILVPAVEALRTKDFKGAWNLLRIALHVLLIQADNRIILASDELRKLLPPNDPLWRQCIDPTDALVRATIKYAQSANKES